MNLLSLASTEQKCPDANPGTFAQTKQFWGWSSIYSPHTSNHILRVLRVLLLSTHHVISKSNFQLMCLLIATTVPAVAPAGPSAAAAPSEAARERRKPGRSWLPRFCRAQEVAPFDEDPPQAGQKPATALRKSATPKALNEDGSAQNKLVRAFSLHTLVGLLCRHLTFTGWVHAVLPSHV